MSENNSFSFLEEQKDSHSDRQKGIIEQYKDGVITIRGLNGLKMSEVVTIEGTSIRALVLNLERDTTQAVVLENSVEIKEGAVVEATGELLSIGADDSLLGRVVDSLGVALDDGKPLSPSTLMPLERIAPGVITRKSVDTPVATGILAIDSLIPVGRGQRELIIGDRQTGKTAIAIDTIINQKGKDMICIYVSVGQRESKLAQVVSTLRDKDALEYTIVVSAPASTTAVMQYLAPFAGTAIAEYFLGLGKDVLIVYDDLSKHAVAYREMSLLLRRPPGREAYPGDVFYLHSRLLERSVKLNEENGGGSITALPIIETQAGDVSAYIPTNVISITDGQIFLETSLFNKGIRPAINVGISVSRVGGAAQTNIMKKVAGPAKLNLTQYYELEAFSQFSSELDASTLAQLVRGRRVVEGLKQNQNAPYALWQEVVVLLAATEGYLDNTDPTECGLAIRQLLTHMAAQHKDLTHTIDTEKKYTDEVKSELKKAFEDYFGK